MRRILVGAIYALGTALGLAAFLYPFVTPTVADVSSYVVQQRVAPLLTAGLVGLSLLVLVLEAQGQSMNAKVIATLGVLVAVTSVLRFIEIAIPLPGGFSPVFAPILIAGYVFGIRFGFLMGVLTLFVSALITGGVGPWLPYQMFTAGWVGLTAGCLPRRGRRWERYALYLCGALWGLAYGAITNLYFWPFAALPNEQSWSQGLGLCEALAHYATFYAVTSLAWDAVRAVGNVALLLVLAAPMIKVLERFRRRFYFEVADG